MVLTGALSWVLPASAYAMLPVVLDTKDTTAILLHQLRNNHNAA